jgi:micrococcal nuclease
MMYVLALVFYILSYTSETPATINESKPSVSHIEISNTPEYIQQNTETPDAAAQQADGIPNAHEATFEVVRVIDGDTIEVLIGHEKKTIRYIGINTPETVHPSKPAECFGREASDRNKALVEGKYVRLEKDISETDKYGRLLRYVYVGDLMINEALVEGGYAYASTYPPDVKYTDVFLKSEKSARENKRGLWSSACTDDSLAPSTAPSTPATVPTSAPPPGQCTIKGNINADDEKIYHMIGCQSYSKTIINESAGEQWFCTEQEALDAGWRKALNC